MCLQEAGSTATAPRQRFDLTSGTAESDAILEMLAQDKFVFTDDCVESADSGGKLVGAALVDEMVLDGAVPGEPVDAAGGITAVAMSVPRRPRRAVRAIGRAGYRMEKDSLALSQTEAWRLGVRVAGSFVCVLEANGQSWPIRVGPVRGSGPAPQSGLQDGAGGLAFQAPSKGESEGGVGC